MRPRIPWFGLSPTAATLILAVACFTLGGVLVGCSSDPAEVDTAEFVQSTPPSIDEMLDLEALAAQRDGGIERMSSNAKVVGLPAGSVDGLAAAIAAAGPRGVVLVKSGPHTESSGVTIGHPVTIIGEPGAVLTIDSDPEPTVSIIDPALHLLHANEVTIWGLEIRPMDPIGGTAILVQDSERVLLARNSIFDHQISILLHHGDHARIWQNTVVASGAWLTGEIIEADGILCMNGQGVFVRGNRVSNALFGIFDSDRGGQATSNTISGCFVGMIMCNVPAAAIALPDGQRVGSDRPATQWLVADNISTGNFDAGYLVIDGSNQNLLVNNAGANNGTYDIDLVGDSTRFGIFTPTSMQNVVIAGRHQGVVIKDCGLENRVFGGVQVDTSQDPCF